MKASLVAVLPLRRSKLQRESGEEVVEGEMPPRRLYTPLHPHAVLSSADRQTIQAWAQGAGRDFGAAASRDQ